MKKSLTIISIFVLCVLLVFTSMPMFVAASKPGKPKGLKITKYNDMYETVAVGLKEKTTTNYQLKVYNYKGALKQKITIKTKKFFGASTYSKRFPYTIENIKAKQFYKITARAYKTKNGKKIYSKYSQPVYACQSFRCDLNERTIYWNKIKGASRYIIKVAKSTEPNKYIKLATAKNNKYVLSDTIYKELGKSFNAKIIAQKKVKNKYYSSDAVATYLWHM